MHTKNKYIFFILLKKKNEEKIPLEKMGWPMCLISWDPILPSLNPPMIWSYSLYVIGFIPSWYTSIIQHLKNQLYWNHRVLFFLWTETIEFLTCIDILEVLAWSKCLFRKKTLRRNGEVMELVWWNQWVVY